MYKVILAIRYLLKRRISYLAFLAVALCVFIVVVVMTVMTGVVGDFKDKNHNFAGDCVVGTESLVGFPYYEDFVKILEQADFVYAVSPVIKSYALVSPGQNSRNVGLELIGIDPLRHIRATGFGDTLYYHQNDPAKAFCPEYDPNSIGFIIGIDRWIARNAEGRYDYESVARNEELIVSCIPLNAKGALSKAGTDVVNTKSFYFSDTSHSGLAKVDYWTIYLPFEQAQMLCGMDGQDKRINAIHIKFKPDEKVNAGCAKVSILWQNFVRENSGRDKANLLQNVTVQSWKSYRRTFIAAMEKEQVMMIAVFMMVGIITVFIVLVVFYMIIGHKSKDIGILKSIGVSSGNIIQLFSGFAFLIGISGSAVGAFCGWLFLLKINSIEEWLFRHFGFQLWDRTIYAIGEIPHRIEPEVLGLIVLAAIAACLAGAIIPSWQAARLKPVDSLRVNQL
jgi:lipoprotein-releasing system permease protein